MAKKSKYTGRAKEVAEKVVQAFESGNVSKPLATVFLSVDKGRPMDNWSWMNRFVCVLSGATDARGFKQWQKVGRTVNKGEKACAYILYPFFRRYTIENEKGESEERQYISGFGASAVFDVLQTDGKPLEYVDTEQQFLDSLPLVEVARAWDLQLTTYSGSKGGPHAWYSHGGVIAMGVENAKTFLHELMHAADHKSGMMTEKGQHWRSETVAELGATVLARMIGLDEAADDGGTYEYVKSYATSAGIEMIDACKEVIERVAHAVTLIMECAEVVT